MQPEYGSENAIYFPYSGFQHQMTMLMYVRVEEYKD